MTNAYKKAGVDIDAGNEAVERIKKHVQTTFRPEVRNGIGGFGSLFALGNKYKNPILVSGTDGVGTKLKVAIEMEQHQTVGIDLVAMCVNDILVQGAEPLFFLDYIATGKLYSDKIEEIVQGIAEGCRLSGCSLIGGETAEMPGMYQANDYDLAGFAVGIVEEDQLIDGSHVQEGDVIIGLPSSGLHSNGFSLVRHILFTEHQYQFGEYIPELNGTLGEVLLTPTKIYASSILPLLDNESIKGMAHITGGGLIENIPRILPKGLQAELNIDAWNMPTIFPFLQRLGDVEHETMYRTFNMGIGFVLIVREKDKIAVIESLESMEEDYHVIGRITKGNKGVVLVGGQ